MFTTDTFSIRAERGMGEFDPPGTYRDRGVEGGARSAREGAVGTESRLVRAERAGSIPLACFSFSAVFLFQKRKSAKNRGMMG